MTERANFLRLVLSKMISKKLSFHNKALTKGEDIIDNFEKALQDYRIYIRFYSYTMSLPEAIPLANFRQWEVLKYYRKILDNEAIPVVLFKTKDGETYVLTTFCDTFLQDRPHVYWAGYFVFVLKDFIEALCILLSERDDPR